MRPLLLVTIALTRASVVDILSRDQPQGELLVAFPIATDDGRQLGDLEFYEKDAAVDTVAAYCSKNELPSWFRKMLAAKVCERTLEADKDLLNKLPVCWRTRALYYEESIQAPDNEQRAPADLNKATTVWGMLMCPLAAVTCFSGPVFLNCCVATPDVHYELRELHDGKVIDGVRYTAKGHTFCAHACKRGLPDGDTIAFAGSTPLPARKDMVLMAAYRASKAAAWPDEG